MTPRAFAFDLYGTLVDYSSLAKSVAFPTPDRAAFVEAWRAKQLQYTFMATVMDRYVDFDRITELALEFTAKRLKVDLDGATRAAMLEAWQRLPAYPDVAPTLRALRERGIRLAVLSNGTPRALANILENANLASAFDAVLSADAVRAYKPDARVYALAVVEFGLPAAQIGFVTSNSWDGAGATAFGFDVFWCNRADLPAETIAPPPARELRSLHDLPERE